MLTPRWAVAVRMQYSTKVASSVIRVSTAGKGASQRVLDRPAKRPAAKFPRAHDRIEQEVLQTIELAERAHSPGRDQNAEPLA